MTKHCIAKVDHAGDIPARRGFAAKDVLRVEVGVDQDRLVTGVDQCRQAGVETVISASQAGEAPAARWRSRQVSKLDLDKFRPVRTRAAKPAIGVLWSRCHHSAQANGNPFALIRVQPIPMCPGKLRKAGRDQVGPALQLAGEMDARNLKIELLGQRGKSQVFAGAVLRPEGGKSLIRRLCSTRKRTLLPGGANSSVLASRPWRRQISCIAGSQTAVSR